MTVEDVQAKIRRVQAAERRILRALRLIAITLSDAMDDMCFITREYDSPTPPQAGEVREAAVKSWANVARLLRLTRGTISNIHDGNGPAFDGYPDLADDCEEALEAWAAPSQRARDKKLLRDLREFKRKTLNAQVKESQSETQEISN
jgi:hypothetical protein